MRDEQHRPVVAGERALELLDRLDVEVVRRLVEDEAVDAARGEERETRRACARPVRAKTPRGGRRRRRGRTSRGVCAPSRCRSRGRRRAAAAPPESAARSCSSSPSTTPGPCQRVPATSGSRPRSASRSVVLPLPFLPAIASRSPQFTSRSSGPSRNAPRSTTAPSSRTTTSPLRAAGARPRRSSHGSYGFSTVSTFLSFAAYVRFTSFDFFFLRPWP